MCSKPCTCVCVYSPPHSHSLYVYFLKKTEVLSMTRGTFSLTRDYSTARTCGHLYLHQHNAGLAASNDDDADTNKNNARGSISTLDADYGGQTIQNIHTRTSTIMCGPSTAHTLTHTRAHTHPYSYTYTYTHNHTHTHTHTYTHAHTRTHTHVHTLTHTQPHTHTYAHTHTHSRAHTHTHTYTHTHTRTHSHTHTHTY